MNLQSLPVVIRRDVPNAQLPALYETAKRALAECVRLDECKDWSDKAAALASYARQAKNSVLEDHAKRIRFRALHRAGELLTEIRQIRSKICKDTYTTRVEASKRAGLSSTERQCAMRLAAMPLSERERLLESKGLPGGASSLRRHLPVIHHTVSFIASTQYRDLVSGSSGLAACGGLLRRIPPSSGKLFNPHEAERIRPFLIKIAEWIDEFERHLPKAKCN